MKWNFSRLKLFLIVLKRSKVRENAVACATKTVGWWSSQRLKMQPCKRTAPGSWSVDCGWRRKILWKSQLFKRFSNLTQHRKPRSRPPNNRLQLALLIKRLSRISAEIRANWLKPSLLWKFQVLNYFQLKVILGNGNFLNKTVVTSFIDGEKNVIQAILIELVIRCHSQWRCRQWNLTN